MMALSNFSVTVDDGVAFVVFDVRGQSMNTLNAAAIADLGAVVEHVSATPDIAGVVFSSGKESGFCAGADLGELSGTKASDLSTTELTRIFRALETCGKPVAAAIEGLALGGGLELALACHYRVATTNPRIKLGLPEAKVGLLPGAGGTQRLPRLIGVAAALPLMLEGTFVDAKKAHELGFIDAVVEPGQAIATATAWVRDVKDPVARWDKKGFKLPGGGPYSPATSQVFITGNALLRQKTFGNYPAQENIMRAVYEGVQVPIDAGLRIESRYFANTFATPQATAMSRSLFMSMQELGKGAVRPSGIARRDIKTAAVLGAGMMGAGIAYVQAAAGIRTLLLDVTQEGADKGKAYSQSIVDKAIKRGTMSADKGAALLALIEPTTDYSKLSAADIVIEAVFEDRSLKAQVTQQAEAHLPPEAIFGSNTSTLPITSLAAASARPANFVGVHFFSPVDRMGLVELIVGKATSQTTLAHAIDYVLSIKKTPIVVNDSRGFYTSRCFGTYVNEGLELLTEGVPPALIDNVGRALSMPRGPLELIDDVAVDLVAKVASATKADLGADYEERPFDALVRRMVELGRFGRKNGKGFYDYRPDGEKTLWPGLAEFAPPAKLTVDATLIEEIRTRLLYRQAVEAARCFAEGVVTDPREADVGAILGWGFSPWTGGPLSLIDGVGLSDFVARCDGLAARCGARFSVPDRLRAMASEGESFYRRPLSLAA